MSSMFSPKNHTIEIPPRKLFLNTIKKQELSPNCASDRHHRRLFELTMQKYLENLDSGDKAGDFCYDPESLDDPFSSDQFRMYDFKIRRCTRSRSHDWTDCPFAHPGEKARRRDPRRYNYSGEVCPEFRRIGTCSRGDSCDFAHGVFECWLHPSRYRTEPCKDGKHCKRKVCFFAHSPSQLRTGQEQIGSCSVKDLTQNCCVFCRGMCDSPTSTLLGLSRSPSISPPLSPVNTKPVFSRFRGCEKPSYEELLHELMSCSLDKMIATTSPVPARINTMNYSPSRLDYHHRSGFGEFSGGGKMVNGKYENGNPGADPDIGWVNDLLM